MSFAITSLIKGYISIILPLVICGITNLIYNGDKIKKITNPKKAFLRVKGIIIAALIMFLLFVFLNNAPISSIEFNLAKVFANIFDIIWWGVCIYTYLDKIIVEQMDWLTKREFIDSIAMGQITPGPILITATFIGYKLGYIFGGNVIINGIFGAFIATISIFLPSSVVIIFFLEYIILLKKYDDKTYNKRI